MSVEQLTRRGFIRGVSQSTAAVSTFTFLQHSLVFGTEANSKVQMGIIGTGGRGQYDGRNLIKTGKVAIVALADYFEHQMDNLARDFEVDSEHCYSGLDGYRQIMEMDAIDAVLLTTPPYFRPQHFDAAIRANKHVFAEKPIAVDAFGCKQFLATSTLAKEKDLTVGAGIQSRYDPTNQEIAQHIQSGVIGKPLIGHSTRMGGDLWRRERPDHFTELDHQINHWLYYCWASGDFIVEMHVHNLDAFNWYTGQLPVSATGSGGREARTDVGDIYDHIQVLYEYPNGFSLSHTGTQIKQSYYGSEKQIIGTKGYFDTQKGLVGESIKLDNLENIKDSTELEMAQFVESVLGNIPTINNGDYVTSSTFTCILGRTAAYEGKRIHWDELWNSDQRLEMPA